MEISKEFSRNLKNGVVTLEMLGACAYSVNKRAKNYRDSLREDYQQLHYCGYGLREYIQRTIDSKEEKKEEYYKMKDYFLSTQKPLCIHSHTRTIIRYDRVEQEEYEDFAEEFFLFYKVDKYQFHHPIKKEEIDKYNLPIEALPPEFETFGESVEDLVSVQFCRKVLNGLKDKTLKLEV